MRHRLTIWPDGLMSFCSFLFPHCIFFGWVPEQFRQYARTMFHPCLRCSAARPRRAACHRHCHCWSRRSKLCFRDRWLRLTSTKLMRSLAFLLEQSPAHDNRREPFSKLRRAELDNVFRFSNKRAPVRYHKWDTISKPRRDDLKRREIGSSAPSARRF